MLRLIVLALLVLNLGYFAWGQGWLLAYGWGPMQQREPQRVAQQIHPEALTVLETPGTAPASSASAAAVPTVQTELVATQCWQVADLDEAQAETLRPLLKTHFSEGVWALDETRLPARWMVYMGKYTNAADLAKKREQLVELKVKFSPLINTAWSPGFSLGVYSSEEAAKTALQDAAQSGVRSAKVIQERPDIQRYRLRLAAVNPADQAALEAIKSALPGKTLDICPATAGAVLPTATATSAPAPADPPTSTPSTR